MCPATDGDEEAGARATPRWATNTTDLVFDVTDALAAGGRRDGVVRWILDTHDQFIDQRFGGWSLANRSASAAELGGTGDNLLVWYNNKGPHALPSYVNAAHNALLRSAAEAAGAGDPEGFGISAFSHPMVVSEDDIVIDSV